MANLTQLEVSLPPCSVSPIHNPTFIFILMTIFQLPCVSKALEASPDFLSNPLTLCNNATVLTPFWACLQRSCNFDQQFQYYNLTHPLCSPFEAPSRGLPAVIETAVLGFVTLLAVATRLYSRHTISKRFGVDDYLIAAAGVIYTGTIVLYIFSKWTRGTEMSS